MAAGAFAPGSKVVIDREGLGAIITALDVQGWEVWGPTVREAAIVLGRISSLDDLPARRRRRAGPGPLPATLGELRVDRQRVQEVEVVRL
jgi:hypothetical protein